MRECRPVALGLVSRRRLCSEGRPPAGGPEGGEGEGHPPGAAPQVEVPASRGKFLPHPGEPFLPHFCVQARPFSAAVCPRNAFNPPAAFRCRLVHRIALRRISGKKRNSAPHSSSWQRPQSPSYRECREEFQGSWRRPSGRVKKSFPPAPPPSSAPARGALFRSRPI